ncbi:DUF2202 domain-containing protein [Sulfurimonas sp.]|uniref:DUF2202 domain-containing protein n=1 Tax=Sulfurimonas sp. TaxID=2022749 RepID=UPI0035614122
MKNILLAGLVVAVMTTSAMAGKKVTTTVSLTDEQLDTLVFIYQEEKVARDTYITLGNMYSNQNVFANIQLSEQEHIDKAEILCDKYGADTSNIDETNVGQFVVPVLQELYDTLIAQGSQSELSALMVGEYVEITDIDDIEHAQVGMPSDVVKTYENLKEGSINHLAAFRSAIDAYNSSN